MLPELPGKCHDMSLDQPKIERDDELLDIPTFMSRNYVSRSVVFREIAAGRLRAWKIGGRRNVFLSGGGSLAERVRRVTPDPLHPRRKHPGHTKYGTHQQAVEPTVAPFRRAGRPDIRLKSIA